MFHNKASFYGEEFFAPRPNLRLEDHPLSAVRNCLFNIFTAKLPTGGFSSIRNLRTHHAVVTETHSSRMQCPHMHNTSVVFRKIGLTLISWTHRL